MDKQKFCIHCGASLSESARFCMACGSKLPDKGSRDGHTEKLPVDKSAGEGDTGAFSGSHIQEKPRKHKWTALVAGCLALVVLAAVGALLFCNRQPTRIEHALSALQVQDYEKAAAMIKEQEDYDSGVIAELLALRGEILEIQENYLQTASMGTEERLNNVTRAYREIAETKIASFLMKYPPDTTSASQGLLTYNDYSMHPALRSFCSTLVTEWLIIMEPDTMENPYYEKHLSLSSRLENLFAVYNMMWSAQENGFRPADAEAELTSLRQQYGQVEEMLPSILDYSLGDSISMYMSYIGSGLAAWDAILEHVGGLGYSSSDWVYLDTDLPAVWEDSIDYGYLAEALLTGDQLIQTQLGNCKLADEMGVMLYEDLINAFVQAFDKAGSSMDLEQ